MINGAISSFPTLEQLEQELQRELYIRQYLRILGSTLAILLTVAAAAVLAAVLFFPVLRIYGSSMEPALEEKNIVVALKTRHFQPGDLMAFYYNNQILVKRVIAAGGQWVNIDSEGTVYVDGMALEEPYIQSKALGSCDIELPFQVPGESFFVLGDQRESSMDSRQRGIGCISQGQIIGKLLFRIWPVEEIGTVAFHQGERRPDE